VRKLLLERGVSERNKMKKIAYLFLLFSLICLFTLPILSQEEKEEKKDLAKELSTEMPKRTLPAYQRAGRKDPFRDLLAGRDSKRETAPSGKPEIYIDDITLIGIVKARGKFTAIVTGPQEFPSFIKAGQRFSDGFVLSIQESRITFRKTKERGFPLFKPRDIVKEIHPEER
jgi:Tfp pilus assembly protein PilP